MPVYVYEAVDFAGNRIKEEIEAENLEEFFEIIERQGLLLLKYKIKRERISLFGRVKRTEIAEFLHNLSFMLRSGIPLITALEDLTAEIKNPYFVKKLKKMLRDLYSGLSFYESAQNSKLFSSTVLALIKIGEESGRLDKTLKDASDHLYRIEEIISQTKRALTYPTFVIISMSFAFGIWFFYVLPKIAEMFKAMNLSLPAPTLALIFVVNTIKKYFFFVLFSFISLIGLVYILYKNRRTQFYIEKVWFKIPLLGRVKRLNFLGFFFEFSSLLLKSGVELMRSLDIMEASFYTQYPKKMIKHIKEALLAGQSFSEALSAIPVFKRLDLRMIAIGERTGRLPEQLEMLANFYYQEIRNLVENLTKIIEPLLLIFAGILFFLIIISLLMPIYDLISKIGMY